MKNTLYYGDNLDILRRYVRDESIDLTYLDPPFKSGQDYNILFKEGDGTKSTAQIKVFEDTWHWDRAAEDAFREITETERKFPQKVKSLVIAFRSFLGENDMMAYLVMMAIRLQELHRILKPTGSIYLHCDPTASHYLKLIMDAIFGIKNFRNEIVWNYVSGGISQRTFARKHDLLYFYSKTDDYFFKPLRERKKKYVDLDLTQCLKDAKGKFVWYIRPGTNSKVPNGVKTYINGFMQDVWQLPIVNPQAKERLGYPTQKPEALLERIIKASSNEGDVVLDPFCGCGTTIAVAEKLKRKWIGIDITHLAISLMRHRLEDSFGEEVEYEVIGEPVDLKGAEQLAKDDPYQFQWWALGLVGARPAESEKKKGADEGKDGYIYFHDDPKKSKTKTVILQVKSGHVNRGMIDALKGVVEREEAQIGAFITLKKPTKPMKKNAVSAKYYKSPLGHNYSKIQILTIKQLFQGKKIDYPSRATGIDATFKKAEKYEKRQEKQAEMF